MKLCVYDIETINTKNMTLAMVGFWDGYKYSYYEHIKDFLKKVLIRKYNGFNFYAHAGGRFDIRFILEELNKNMFLYDDYSFELLSISSSIILIIKKNKYKWVFADSYLLFRMSLKKLGSAFDLEYRKKEHNFEEDFVMNDDNIEYNKIDCLSLYEALLKFYSLLKLKKPTLTIASTALKIYTKNFIDITKYCPSMKQKAEMLVRRTYFGGRCEIFKQTMKKGYCYDFNSLYPSVMLEKMPIGFYKFVSERRNKHSIGFYNADVFVPSMLIPPLPYRFKSKLLFPFGSWNGYFTGIELDLLEEIGGSYKINDGVEFNKTAYLFKGYVNTYYKLKNDSKKNGNLALCEISKFMLNSLYGKFGQRRENQTLFLNPSNIKEMDFLYDDELNIFGKNEISKAKHILPYISAHITALARVKLYRAFMKVGFDNIYYCDTDSIFTNKIIESSDKLGELRLEYDCSDFTFTLPKTYYGFNTTENLDVNKAKGFDKNYDFAQEIIKLAGIKECIKNNNKNIIASEYDFIKFKYYTKQNLAVYNKRIVLDNNITSPLSFENDIIPLMNFYDRPDITDEEKIERYNETINKYKGSDLKENKFRQNYIDAHQGSLYSDF